ncbi:MAG: hypothetical protein NUV56_01120 [Candidatus Uhrbacteria bacterium]|nr:hypothetical protein [Candidatus Uhrbacteria bacterium]
MPTNLILVLDADPLNRVDPFVRKYQHLRFEYFGEGLDQAALTRESKELLERDLSPYAAIVVSSLKTSHGPSIYRITESFIARGKLVVGLIFHPSISSLVREMLGKQGVKRFAHFGPGLQTEILKLMREGLLPLAT